MLIFCYAVYGRLLQAEAHCKSYISKHHFANGFTIHSYVCGRVSWKVQHTSGRSATLVSGAQCTRSYTCKNQDKVEGQARSSLEDPQLCL